jgi:hypothetical protein
MNWQYLPPSPSLSSILVRAGFSSLAGEFSSLPEPPLREVPWESVRLSTAGLDTVYHQSLGNQPVDSVDLTTDLIAAPRSLRDAIIRCRRSFIQECTQGKSNV